MEIDANMDGYLSARRLAKRVLSTVHNIGIYHWKDLCAAFCKPKTIFESSHVVVVFSSSK
jgi:hypothetical protein